MSSFIEVPLRKQNTNNIDWGVVSGEIIHSASLNSSDDYSSDDDDDDDDSLGSRAFLLLIDNPEQAQLNWNSLVDKLLEREKEKEKNQMKELSCVKRQRRSLVRPDDDDDDCGCSQYRSDFE